MLDRVHIDVEHLGVRYPRATGWALRDLSFTVARGETLLLLGPSGSGKSTIGLCLAGLIPNSVPARVEGRILFDGVCASEVAIGERTAKIGMVFQDPEAQFCMLTVEDEVAFGLENLAVPREEMDGRIREALTLVGLNDRRRERVDRLSGGQKQRLALACALAMRPATLFLDEPTSNLDPATRYGFFQFLKTLHRERPQLTIIIVEHVLDDLIEMVDRVLALDAGHKGPLVGEPASLFDRRGQALDEMGIWLPQVTVLARKLRLAGLPVAQLPLTVAEAAAQLEHLVVRRAIARRGNAQGRGDSSQILAKPGPIAPIPPLSGKPETHRGARPSSRALGRAGRGEVTSPPNIPPAISVRDLSFRYGYGPVVLDKVSLEVAQGSFSALVGPNGAGKTTLASHLVAILRPGPGRVRILGDDITQLTTAEITDRVGYVFQNPEHQFVEQRVEDELAYSLRVRQRPTSQIKPVVDQLLNDFGLALHRLANPFSLSQGQKRRLSVATMLALGQRILVLDEPTFGQDRNTAHALMERLCALQRQGVTVLAITHDMQLVADYAERTAVLVDGAVRFLGPTPQLFGNQALLREASLRSPPLHELARALGLIRQDGALPMSIRDWYPFFDLAAPIGPIATCTNGTQA